MSRFIISFFLFLLSMSLYAHDWNKKWFQGGKKEKSQVAVSTLLSIIQGSALGKNLIQKAQVRAKEYGADLIELITPGDGSITGTTLTRNFQADNPLEVSYRTTAHITINRDLSLYYAVLDLAHELTHFVYRKNFNPYLVNFTAKEFVHLTVEGDGGEVDAYMAECQILKELFGERRVRNSGCSRIYDSKKRGPSREAAIEHFYRVGDYYDEFKKHFNSGRKVASHDYPYLSKKEVSFYSSAYSLPYPVAALYEYKTVLKSACENDRKRLKYIQSGLQRKYKGKLYQKLYSSVVNSFNSRCQSVVILK